MKGIAAVVAIVFTLSLAAYGVTNFFLGISYKNNVGGHLKRAADSNTVELAKQELQTALTWLEQHGKTSGHTSIFWNTPDEDIGFWYNNLKSSLDELEKLPATSSAMEKSNMLMKLRETLLDADEKGTHVTEPDGIKRHPHNLAYALWAWISGILALIGWIIVGAD